MGCGVLVATGAGMGVGGIRVGINAGCGVLVGTEVGIGIGGCVAAALEIGVEM